VFPIRDINPVSIKPWVKYTFIGVCVVVFFVFQSHETARETEEFLFRQAVISCEVMTGEPLSLREIVEQVCLDGSEPPLFPDKNPWLAVLTSMFLHGGLAHLGFNMWFLWIFGNNVEEAYGHFWFFLLYIMGGVAATMAFVLANPDSTVPLVGASGAIAAVLGSYAVLYPTHKVVTLLFWILVPIPAAVFLGIWFVLQFGLGGGNIAWEAHVGGFIFGVVATIPFRRRLLSRVG
jgi:membrane associated rhomboid family serine protease